MSPSCQKIVFWLPLVRSNCRRNPERSRTSCLGARPEASARLRTECPSVIGPLRYPRKRRRAKPLYAPLINSSSTQSESSLAPSEQQKTEAGERRTSIGIGRLSPRAHNSLCPIFPPNHESGPLLLRHHPQSSGTYSCLAP